MDVKADKAALESKVNVSTFDNSFNMLDEGLREALQKMDDYMNEEMALKQALKQLSADMSEKMDGQALQAVKNYLGIGSSGRSSRSPYFAMFDKLEAKKKEISVQIYRSCHVALLVICCFFTLNRQSIIGRLHCYLFLFVCFVSPVFFFFVSGS